MHAVSAGGDFLGQACAVLAIRSRRRVDPCLTIAAGLISGLVHESPYTGEKVGPGAGMGLKRTAAFADGGPCSCSTVAAAASHTAASRTAGLLAPVLPQGVPVPRAGAGRQ